MSVTCPTCSREFPDGAVTCSADGTALTGAQLWDDSTRASLPKVGEKSGAKARWVGDLTGVTVGDYLVGELLGSGGMGDVYAGEQPVIGKKVALKVLKLEIAADQGNVKRMLAEARAVNAIRHRGIVDIFNFGTLPDGRPYLVMEYLVGQPLDALLDAQGALAPAEACRVLEEVASALQAAHAAGVIHRDLKPANTYLSKDSSSPISYVKLLDFGLAKSTEVAASGPLTQAGMVVGTPDYIAPEQARGLPVTGRTDLYSMGVMAFEVLTGQLPFKGASVAELVMHHLKTAPPRPSSLVPGLPESLDALVLSLLEKEPGDRPESAEVVRHEFKRLEAELRAGTTQARAPGARPVRAVGARATGAPPTERVRAIHAPEPHAAETVEGMPALPREVRAAGTGATSVDVMRAAGSRPGVLVAGGVGLGVLALVAVLALTLRAAPVPSTAGGELEPKVAVAPPVEVPPVPPPVRPTAGPGETALPDVPPRPPVGPSTPEPTARPLPTTPPGPPNGRTPPVVPVVTGRTRPPVQPVPAKPLPRPDPVATPRLVAPSREQLHVDLERAVKRVRETPLSPQLIERLADNLKKEINAAETPEQRAQALKDVKDFERRYLR